VEVEPSQKRPDKDQYHTENRKKEREKVLRPTQIEKTNSPVRAKKTKDQRGGFKNVSQPVIYYQDERGNKGKKQKRRGSEMEEKKGGKKKKKKE